MESVLFEMAEGAGGRQVQKKGSKKEFPLSRQLVAAELFAKDRQIWDETERQIYSFGAGAKKERSPTSWAVLRRYNVCKVCTGRTYLASFRFSGWRMGSFYWSCGLTLSMKYT
jgi:hypothetical protein